MKRSKKIKKKKILQKTRSILWVYLILNAPMLIYDAHAQEQEEAEKNAKRKTCC
jgi:hypothetical protein